MSTHARLTAALADRYRLERELGQGGMATVYLAHDLKHDRDVAIKVLHPDLGAALGGERFLSEIRTTARLQHPHILPLLDSGEADGLLYYVMPLVTGETLRARLERDRQLPVEEAIRTAREVADALQYAHEHGVIHRDIKPENILLQGGHALVADFGIALAVQSAGGQRMTQTGLSLGTPQYMSPEQAMGEKQIDARSDIYALAAVTYEMLVGEAPFTGPTVQAIVARLITEEPRAIGSQRKAVPESVEAAVLRALEKLPADRFATAAEFAAALVNPTLATAATSRTRAMAATPRSNRAVALLGGVTVLSLAAAAFAWFRPAPVEAPNWQTIVVSDSLEFDQPGSMLAISPTGENILFRKSIQNSPIWLKRADRLEAAAIPGTERGATPAFSPDGQWIAFTADRQLKKVRLDGGASMILADSAASQEYGLAWLDDNTIIYPSPSGSELRRVSAAGGGYTVAFADTALRGFGLLNVTALPDARGVLAAVCTSNCATSTMSVIDLKTSKLTRLLPDVMKAWYLPSGNLLYVRTDFTAMVAPFDLDKLTITGPATAVLDGTTIHALFRTVPMLAISRSGTLLFARGKAGTGTSEFVRVDRQGVATRIDTSWSGVFNSFALSADGRRVAVGTGTTGGGLSIYLKQLDAGAFSRLSFGGQDRRPTWSPDGKTVAFVRDSLNGGGVYGIAADGSGGERRLARIDRPIQEVIWSNDGQWLVLRTDNGTAGAGDLVGVRTSGDSTPVPLVASKFTEMHPALSPDGRWLAYISDESGANEIYVRPFPATNGGRWQVSNGGGMSPVWSPDSKELYFISASNKLVAAELLTTAGFEVVQLRPLFDTNGYNLDLFHSSFAVSPDGKSFLFSRQRATGVGTARPTIILVRNWFADLAARLKR
ncbi:MAG: serine/threonine-protein kinase [Gemmatimonadetes bacterium]|nr:serine/threonine-protein kinase [Gemmatimonadota bacterium]